MAETPVEEKAESAEGLAEVDAIAVRFAGDSGDGSQLIGGEFANTSAILGNDISTLPDYPAEIRAPAGTLAGVSGFQIHFASEDIHTPADEPDLLVAFNPAALLANIKAVRSKGMIIINVDAFTKKALHRAGYAHSVEAWKDGALVGGLYGISLGRCFFGESMFSLEPNASKIALATLVYHLLCHGFSLIDCQVHTPHLESLGARDIPRDSFLTLLEKANTGETRVGKWTFDKEREK